MSAQNECTNNHYLIWLKPYDLRLKTYVTLRITENGKPHFSGNVGGPGLET